MPATFDSLDDEIAAREAQRASDAVRRRELAAEVQGLQRALEELNAKVSSVRNENVSLAQVRETSASLAHGEAVLVVRRLHGHPTDDLHVCQSLTQENDALSSYIDSLMSSVSAMGSKIAAEKKGGSPGLLKRLSSARRSKVVRVDGNTGELQTKPVAAANGWAPFERSSLGRQQRHSSVGGLASSPHDLAAVTSPMRLSLPSLTEPLPSMSASPLVAAQQASRPSPGQPPPPPPPPPP